MGSESIDKLFDAAAELAEPHEPVAVMIARGRHGYALRVVVGGEVAVHVDACSTPSAALERGRQSCERAISAEQAELFAGAVGA